MGNSAAKKTNSLLDENRKRDYGLSDQMNQYGNEDRNYSTGARNDINSKYNDLYNGIGNRSSSTGSYTPLATAKLNLPGLRDNEAMGTYRNFMNTGGYSDADVAENRARASSTVPSFFQGIKSQMDQAANVRGGGYAGYSGQLAKLGREQAQTGANVTNDAEIKLQDAIRQGKLAGASGVSSLDATKYADEEARAREKYGIDKENINAQNSANAAAAGNSNAQQEQAFRDRMAILGEQRGLRGESGSDLPYFNAAAGNNAAGQNAVNSRVAEPSFLQQAGGFLGGVAGAAAPFINPAKKLLGTGGTKVSGTKLDDRYV